MSRITKFSESTAAAALEWMGSLGYRIAHGPEIAHEESLPEWTCSQDLMEGSI
jgi:hypothetical protein